MAASGDALAIEVGGLVKRYGSHAAVDGIDLVARTGEVLALLGPNGAGKTTTVEILEGLRTRTSGAVSVLGVDPASAPRHAIAAWRERIGVVLQGAQHEGEFTPAELVSLWSNYYSSARPAAQVLELVGLSDAAATRSRRLSGGQRQRLAVALALVGNPELVFLDEPTTGFDPAARREAWQMIDGLRSLGVTVLLTTHYMDEADRLADRIVVMSAGRIVANGTAADLAAQVDMPTRISWAAAELGRGEVPAGLTVQPSAAAGRLETTAHEVGAAVRELLEAASAAGVPLDSLAVEPPTLEDTYLALTGHEAQSFEAQSFEAQSSGAQS